MIQCMMRQSKGDIVIQGNKVMLTEEKYETTEVNKKDSDNKKQIPRTTVSSDIYIPNMFVKNLILYFPWVH